MHALRNSTKVRLALSGLVGLVVATLMWMPVDGHLAVASGITIAEIVFITASAVLLWTMDERETAEHATREDFNPITDEILVGVASLLAIISMITLRFIASDHSGGFAAIATLIGVFGAWACVHQTYALHYAYMYYVDPVGGIDFNQTEQPRYSDFVYVSYAVGMTYGVTDTNVTDSKMRSVVVRHGITSFVFGVVILGAAINIVAGIFGLNG